MSRIQKVIIAEDVKSIHQGLASVLKEINIAETEFVQYCDDAYLLIKKAEQNQEPYHLLITDLSFARDHRDVNLEDGEALIKALKEGIIDFVTSDHNPLDTELKKVEFDHAAYGTIGLESAFGALQTVVSTEKAIELLTSGKLRFGIPSEKIKVGSNANLTLFNPDETYTFENNHILSTSKNSAFLGENLKGKVYGILANNQLLVK